MSPSKVHVLSESRVHPHATPTIPTTTPLSIIDASVAGFTPCGAIWYFPPLSATSPEALDPQALRTNLAHTLEAYPQWTGQLRMTPYVSGKSVGERKNHERYGRMEVRYGYGTDPGVDFVVANIDATLEDALSHHSHTGVWDCSGLVREDVLLPKKALAGLNSAAEHGDPCVAVQITLFKGGGTAVGVQIAHCLADAIALSRFMHDWSAVHTALLSSSQLPSLCPSFEPWAMDQRAAKSLDDTVPDQGVLEKAYKLPAHRHDWWSSAEGSGFGPGAHAIPEVLRNDMAAKEMAVNGSKMPWGTYDVQAPVAHTVIHFTAGELDEIWNAASKEGDFGSKKVILSRHDALVAHVWTLINRARGPENGDGESIVHADVTIGLRTRVFPPLPSSFLGSPLQIANVELPWSIASSSSSLPAIASTIKSTIQEFTPEAVAAQIYATAHELSPQRLWQAFLGKEHVIFTSWAHTGLYECDFGTGLAPRYVHPIMPLVDGCVQIMESAPKNGPSRSQEGKKWYSDGVDVAIYLEQEAMGRLVKDPRIHDLRPS